MLEPNTRKLGYREAEKKVSSKENGQVEKERGQGRSEGRPPPGQTRRERKEGQLSSASSIKSSDSQLENRCRKYAKPKDKEKPYFSVWSVCRAHLCSTRVVLPAAETTGQHSPCYSRVRRLRFPHVLMGLLSYACLTRCGSRPSCIHVQRKDKGFSLSSVIQARSCSHCCRAPLLP